MTLPRFFICDLELETNKEYTLSPSDSHHAVKVLRLQEGDEVEVSDGKGRGFAARVIATDTSASRVQVTAPLRESRESPLHVTLVQGLLKGDNMDLVVRQAVELGAHRIIPLVTARSVPRLQRQRTLKKRERWLNVARAAAGQCGRDILPDVEIPVDWSDVEGVLESEETALNLFFWEGEKSQVLHGPESGITRIAVFVGPEGGFNREEAGELKSKGVQVAGMGPRILRAETAATAALTLVQLIYGDLGGLQE